MYAARVNIFQLSPCARQGRWLSGQEICHGLDGAQQRFPHPETFGTGGLCQFGTEGMGDAPDKRDGQVGAAVWRDVATEKQAEAIRNVITEFLNGVAKHSGIRLSARKAPDGTVPQEGLILALMRLRMGEELRQGMTEDLEKLKDGLVEGGERIEIRNGLHWLVAPKDSKERTVKAVKDLEGFIAGDLCQDAIRRVREYRELSEVTPEQALEDFQKHGGDYYALMEAHGGSTLEKPLIYSSIPAQLAEAIDGMEIDLRCFKGNLRSYQLFGAKYVLFERRVLLGDEMGLGKTVQAVAAMCDIYFGVLTSDMAATASTLARASSRCPRRWR